MRFAGAIPHRAPLKVQVRATPRKTRYRPERKATIGRPPEITTELTMNHSPAPIQLLVWQDFDDFWRELEGSHAETPYTFDAYDEEVARIAFKAGRESMRQQVVAVVERLLVMRRLAQPTEAQVSEVGHAVLREIVEDMTGLVRAQDN